MPKAAPHTPLHPRGEIRHWHAVAILSAMALLFFKDILLGNAYLWEDFLYYSFPVRNFAAVSLSRGEFPFWNPYTFNGMPFFADIQTSVLYIPCLLLTLFVRDGFLGHYWVELMMIAHYIVAGVCMYALALSFGLRRIPALFAGLAYMLSGFMVLHAIHQQIITMAAWFPLILLLLRRTLARPGWLNVCLTAIVLGHSILAGFPQLTLYLYFFLGAFVLYELLTAYRGRALLSPEALGAAGRALAVVALSIALAAIQLIPTMELSDLSQRAAITYERSTEGQMSWSHLLTLIFPKFFGVANATSYQYWGPGVYWYYWETCIYRGALPLILAILSILLWKRHRIVPFLWGFSVFGLLFALGDNFVLHRLMYEFVPGFATFRSPARMLAFMGIAVALLSAFSLQELLYGDAGSAAARRWRTLLLGIGGGAALLWLLIAAGVFDGAFAFLQTPAIASLVRREANLSFFLFALATALTLLMVMKRPAAAWTGWAAMALTLFDLMLFGASQNNAVQNPTTYFRRPQEIIRYFREHAGGEYFRVNTRNERGMIMDRNQGMIDRIAMMEGYTPLALQRVYPPVASPDRMFDLLNVKFKTVSRDEQRSLAVEPRKGYLPRAFVVYDVRVAPDEQSLTAMLNDSTFDPARTAILETDPGLARTGTGTAPSWKADITSYGDNTIVLDVRSGAPGLLVVSEIYYPGWTATVDGAETPVLRTDYNLRGIVVPAGSHAVTFRFRPTNFAAAAGISLAALLVCLTGIFIPLTKRRSARAPES